MNERGFPESVKQFATYLYELQNSLDPESYALLLRILQGTNDAIVNRGTNVFFSPRDKELFTPEFAESLRKLLGLLGPLGMQTVFDLDFDTDPGMETTRIDSPADAQPPQKSTHLADQEELRREVEAIARASGLEP